MADFTALKTAIQNAIKQNGNEEITGAILQEVMLAVVSTLGDSAINDLIAALSTEVTNRQNADGTLQSNINAEQSARQLGDSTLQSGINNERDLRVAADNALSNRITAISDAIDNGYVYAGIATTSTEPATGKVFYLTTATGVFTNFGGITVNTKGIKILKMVGSTWTSDTVIVMDDTPTENSTNLVKSGGVYASIASVLSKIAEGYLYVGIATAATNPSTSTTKVFYIATAAGTYTNFLDSSSQSLVLTQGINILKFNGSAWSLDAFIGIDYALNANSSNLLENKVITENFVRRPTEQTENLYDTYDLFKDRNGASYSDGVITAQAATLYGFIDIPIEDGVYTVSFIAKCDGNISTTGVGFYVRFNYTDGTHVSVETSYLNNNQNTFVQLYATSNSSKTISSIELRGSAGSLNTIHVKEFQIRKAASVLTYITRVSSIDYNSRKAISDLDSKLGYYICDTAGNVNVKTVNAPGFKLEKGGSIKIKMLHANNNSNDIYLNINNTGNKNIYYNGLLVNDNNNTFIVTWRDNEIIEVYYDGEAYQAKTVFAGDDAINTFVIFDQASTNIYNNVFFYGAALKQDEDYVTMSLMKSNHRRISTIVPIPAGIMKLKGTLSVSLCRFIDYALDVNNDYVKYKITDDSRGCSYNVTYETVENENITVISIVGNKGAFFTLRDRDDSTANVTYEFISFESQLVDFYDLTLPKGVISANGVVASSFVLGGWSSRIIVREDPQDPNSPIKAVYTDYHKTYSNRFCTLFPISSGTLKFKGQLKGTFWQVKKLESYLISDIKYEIFYAGAQRTFEYDEINDITTITIDSVYPVLASLGYVDDRRITEVPEFISFEPKSEKTEVYELPLHFTTPWKDGEHNCIGQPTMVVADDGTIIVSGYWGENYFYTDLFNSISHDGGATWETDWESGKPSMVWDKVNHRLVSVWGTNAYISNDYGMTWTDLGAVDCDPEHISHDFYAKFDTYRQEEAAYYVEHPDTDKRYAFQIYDSMTANSGCQLANGVLCIPRNVLIKKIQAGNVNNDDEIPEGCEADANGWIIYSDTHYPAVLEKYRKDLNTMEITDTVAYVKYSKDYGYTWQNSPVTPINVICSENFPIEADENQVCINARGGTESVWSDTTAIRHLWFQHTPVSSRENFTIDSWDADYGTRITNTIDDSLINAGGEKVVYQVPGSSLAPIKFWLFCNIYNPGSFDRHTQMLRLSTDCHNWLDLKVITPLNRLLSGYVDIASDSSHIYIVLEGNRNNAEDTMMFARVDSELLKDILSTYDTAKKYFPDV